MNEYYTHNQFQISKCQVLSRLTSVKSGLATCMRWTYTKFASVQNGLRPSRSIFSQKDKNAGKLECSFDTTHGNISALQFEIEDGETYADHPLWDASQSASVQSARERR